MTAIARASTYAIVKRALDVTFSTAALIVTAPLQACIALVVRAALGRPVFFRQERPGVDGKLFPLIKFRTMLEPDASRSLIDDESRMTALGKFLRSTSLDELPSLWNVLWGHMSVVGPRPLLPEYLPLYSPRQATRHDVRPGITGLAQVSGRNNTTWNERLELDAQYVEDYSLALDARVFAATLFVVMRRDGVSAQGHVTMTRFSGAEVPRPAGEGEPR